jgi:hypothetical protein
MIEKQKPRPTLRLTIRQPEDAGNPEVVMNDHLEAIDAEGNVVADLQHILAGATVERYVGSAALVELRLYGVEIVREGQPDTR